MKCQGLSCSILWDWLQQWWASVYHLGMGDLLSNELLRGSMHGGNQFIAAHQRRSLLLVTAHILLPLCKESRLVSDAKPFTSPAERHRVLYASECGKFPRNSTRCGGWINIQLSPMSSAVHHRLSGDNALALCRSVELAKDSYLSSAFAGWITGV